MTAAFSSEQSGVGLTEVLMLLVLIHIMFQTTNDFTVLPCDQRGAQETVGAPIVNLTILIMQDFLETNSILMTFPFSLCVNKTFR